MTLPDISVFGNFPPQTGYQGPGTGPAPRQDQALLPGELRLSSRGLPVSVPEAFTQPRRQSYVSVSDTASTVTQPQRRYRHGRRPQLTTQQRHEQRRSYTGQSLHFNYTGSRLERAPLHWVITIFLKIIDSNVKKSLVKTNTRFIRNTCLQRASGYYEQVSLSQNHCQQCFKVRFSVNHFTRFKRDHMWFKVESNFNTNFRFFWGFFFCLFFFVIGKFACTWQTVDIVQVKIVQGNRLCCRYF